MNWITVGAEGVVFFGACGTSFWDKGIRINKIHFESAPFGFADTRYLWETAYLVQECDASSGASQKVRD